MLTSLELEEITGVAPYERLGLRDTNSRKSQPSRLVCRAVLYRHSAGPWQQPVGVRIREISTTTVGVLCDAASAPQETEPFTLGIERKGARGGSASAQPLWLRCATLQRVATGWSSRYFVTACFMERTEAPKVAPADPEAIASARAAFPSRRSGRGDAVLDLLFEQHPFGLAFVTPDNRIGRANRAFCEIVGYTAAELGRLTFVDFTHPDDVGADLQLAVRLFAGEIHSYQIEKRYIQKSGAVVSVHLTASVLRDPSGRIAGAIATAQPLAASEDSASELTRLRKAILD